MSDDAFVQEWDELMDAALESGETEEERRGGGARGRRLAGGRPRPRPVRPVRPVRPRPPWRPVRDPWPPPPWGTTAAAAVVEPAPVEAAAGPPATEYTRWVQSALNDVLGAGLAVDGVMTAATRAAIRRFQQRERLPADGIVGPDTERVLQAARHRGPVPARELAGFDTELAEEVAGPDRRSSAYGRWVQTALNRIISAGLVVDGIQGTRTRAAVRQFQRQRGLTADGIVGPQTERALVAAGAPPPPTGPAPAPVTPVDSRMFVVRGVGLPAAPALTVANFHAPGVARLRGSVRPGRAVTEFVIHETVTRSVADTVAVLQQRGLSVHLIMGPDGALTQHGDLGDEVLWHASQHNGPSVGVEVVNPYYPRYLKAGMPWGRTIEAGWAHEGRYVLPTPAQAEATARLTSWIASPAARGLGIPRRWIGVSDGRMRLGRVPGAENTAPGIYAHTYFNHADGSWLALYAWLRLEGGVAPAEAYETAVRLATTRESTVRLPEPRPGGLVPELPLVASPAGGW